MADAGPEGGDNYIDLHALAPPSSKVFKDRFEYFKDLLNRPDLSLDEILAENFSEADITLLTPTSLPYIQAMQARNNSQYAARHEQDDISNDELENPLAWKLTMRSFGHPTETIKALEKPKGMLWQVLEDMTAERPLIKFLDEHDNRTFGLKAMKGRKHNVPPIDLNGSPFPGHRNGIEDDSGSNHFFGYVSDSNVSDESDDRMDSDKEGELSNQEDAQLGKHIFRDPYPLKDIDIHDVEIHDRPDIPKCWVPEEDIINKTINRADDNHKHPIHLSKSTTHHVLPRYRLYGFQGATTFDYNEFSFLRAIRRLLSLAEDEEANFNLIFFNKTPGNIEYSVAGHAPLLMTDSPNLLRYIVGHKRKTGTTRDCFDTCAWFVCLRDENPPPTWQPTLKQLQTDVATIASDDPARSVCYIGFPKIKAPSQWTPEATRHWNSLDYRTYFRTALNVLAGKDTKHGFKKLALELRPAYSSNQHTYMHGWAAPNASYLWNLHPQNSGLGKGNSVPRNSTHWLKWSQSKDEIRLVLPNYFPSEIYESDTILNESNATIDSTYAVSKATTMIRRSLGDEAESVTHIYFVVGRHFRVEVPFTNTLDGPDMEQMVKAFRQSQESGLPIVVHPVWKRNLDAREDVFEESKGPWGPWHWRRVMVLPSYGSRIEDFKRATSAKGTPFKWLKITSFSMAKSKKPEDTEFETFYLGPHTTEAQWSSIRLRITTQFAKITTMEEKDTRYAEKTPNTWTQEDAKWIERIPKSNVWGPRYGNLAKPSRNRWKVSSITRQNIIKALIQKQPLMLAKSEQLPVPDPAPKVETVIRSSEAAPWISKRVLTPTEQQKLKNAYYELRQLMLQRPIICHYQGCDFHFCMSELKKFEDHLLNWHERNKCTWCVMHFPEHWMVEKHIEEKHLKTIARVLEAANANSKITRNSPPASPPPGFEIFTGERPVLPPSQSQAALSTGSRSTLGLSESRDALLTVDRPVFALSQSRTASWSDDEGQDPPWQELDKGILLLKHKPPLVLSRFKAGLVIDPEQRELTLKLGELERMKADYVRKDDKWVLRGPDVSGPQPEIEHQFMPKPEVTKPFEPEPEVKHKFEPQHKVKKDEVKKDEVKKDEVKKDEVKDEVKNTKEKRPDKERSKERKPKEKRPKKKRPKEKKPKEKKLAGEARGRLLKSKDARNDGRERRASSPDWIALLGPEDPSFIPDEGSYCSKCLRKVPKVKGAAQKDQPSRFEQIAVHTDKTRCCRIRSGIGSNENLPNKSGWIPSKETKGLLLKVRQEFPKEYAGYDKTLYPLDSRDKTNQNWRSDPNNDSNKASWALPWPPYKGQAAPEEPKESQISDDESLDDDISDEVDAVLEDYLPDDGNDDDDFVTGDVDVDYKTAPDPYGKKRRRRRQMVDGEYVYLSDSDSDDGLVPDFDDLKQGSPTIVLNEPDMEDTEGPKKLKKSKLEKKNKITKRQKTTPADPTFKPGQVEPSEEEEELILHEFEIDELSGPQKMLKKNKKPEDPTFKPSQFEAPEDEPESILPFPQKRKKPEDPTFRPNQLDPVVEEDPEPELIRKKRKLPDDAELNIYSGQSIVDAEVVLPSPTKKVKLGERKGFVKKRRAPRRGGAGKGGKATEK